MTTEALFWIGIILLSPTMLVLGRYVTKLILDIVLPDDRIVVGFTDYQGKKRRKVIRLDKDDEMFQILDEVRSSQAERRSRHA